MKTSERRKLFSARCMWHETDKRAFHENEKAKLLYSLHIGSIVSRRSSLTFKMVSSTSNGNELDLFVGILTYRKRDSFNSMNGNEMKLKTPQRRQKLFMQSIAICFPSKWKKGKKRRKNFSLWMDSFRYRAHKLHDNFLPASVLPPRFWLKNINSSAFPPFAQKKAERNWNGKQFGGVFLLWDCRSS